MQFGKWHVRSTVNLTLALWLIVVIGAGAADLASGDPAFVVHTLQFLPLAIFGAAECLVVGWVLSRVPERARALRWFFAALAIPAASILWALVVHWSTRHYSTFAFFITRIWTFVAWTSAWLALQYRDRLAEHDLRLARAESTASEARGGMLRYQLNPHFLFNSLNAISALVLHEDFERAGKVLGSLVTFLRTTLARLPQESATVADEVNVQREYLKIEKARFDDRLAVKIIVDDAAAGCLVPSFILQPLIENAIKYGLMPSNQKITVTIEARLVGDKLCLTVRDDGGGATPRVDGLGVGLENVRRRLSLLFGAQATLSTVMREGGFSATVMVPITSMT